MPNFVQNLSVVSGTDEAISVLEQLFNETKRLLQGQTQAVRLSKAYQNLLSTPVFKKDKISSHR